MSTRRFLDGTQPDGSVYCYEFKKEPWPQITFKIKTADGTVSYLKKEIVGCSDSNALFVAYDYSGDLPCRLDLECFFSFRNYHSLRKKDQNSPPVVSFKDNRLLVEDKEKAQKLIVYTPNLAYEHLPEWYRDLYYAEEKERGYDFTEDLYRSGVLTGELGPQGRVEILVTEDEIADPPFIVFEKEGERRASLQKERGDDSLFFSELVKSSDQFLVKTKTKDYQIMAGYPWFVVWGRDTMISLPGICLVNKRFEEAKTILRTWTEHLYQGLIPNRLSTKAGPPDYNTVDASLWFMVSAYKYYKYTQDKNFLLESLLPACLEILNWHQRGTLYDIRVDYDGLLNAGSLSTQLTWMDAMWDSKPVTPRDGKPVEVNALWVNALFITSFFLSEAGRQDEADVYQQIATATKNSFELAFWNNESGCLFDVVKTLENGELSRDSSIRPNQLFSLSLPVKLLGLEKSLSILNVVKEHLLTPVGLRTLSPCDQHYKAEYVGTQEVRDSSYHQGTVWPWLIGSYITAVLRFRGQEARPEIDSIFEGFQEEMNVSGAIGTLSEIYDGDSPHAAKGAFAQAWSVAEILRSYYEDYLGNSVFLELESK